MQRQRSSSARGRGGRAAAATLVTLALAGCGGGSEVEDGATVTVYAGAPACGPARKELARSRPEAGSVRVKVVCTASVDSGEGLDLAAAGADARRAVEDSRAVAYLEAPGPAVPFIRPILDEAEIALIADDSGAGAMATVLDLLEARGSDQSPRESVWAAR